MILVTVLLSVVISYILFHIVKLIIWVRRADKMTANIPSPPSLPIIGNALYFTKVRSREDTLKLATCVPSTINERGYYRIGKLWLGPILIISLGDPKDIDEVLLSKDAVNKDRVYKYFALVIDGMIVKNGKEWHDLRKPLNKILTKQMIESCLTTMHQKALKLCERWDSVADSGKVHNLRPELANFSADNVCANVCGYDLNELENNKLDLCATLERTIALWIQLLTQVPSNLSVTYSRYSQKGRNLAKVSRVFTDTCIQMLRDNMKRKETIKDNNEEHTKNFIDVLSELKAKENLSEEETARLATDVFIAGFDTTSVTAATVLLMLAMFPEHQEAVYEEQLKIVGDDPTVIPTWDQLSSMEYLGRVIKETLRLYCPLALFRQLSKDIDLGDYTLPAGCTLYIRLHCLHRNPKFWSHPNEFYPDHFLSEAIANRPKGCYFPFSAGPRGCPGKLYGTIVMKMLLSTLLRKYKFETDLKYKGLKYKYSIQLEVSGGYLCRIKHRNKESENVS
ncbi:hypothetical protein O3M35_004730 [Rhynocoris fuscipes]|uniref:Cytochrome P450 n=2 Tax=Rhynocoris fuscipes TaxID=488301 RepID=A0AAW1DIE2_9HEMI